MRAVSSSSVALGLLISVQAWGQPSAAASPDLDRLDSYIEKARAEWEVPGLSVAIVKDGKVAFAKGYGVKELGRQDRVDADTLFAIASNTKAFTSAALAILSDEKKVKWDDRVSDILPYFELSDPWVSHEMRVDDLLCHRSGLKTFSGDLLWYGTPYTREEIIRRARYLKSAFPFRAGYGYSNLMFLAAGEVVAKASGRSWDDFVRERILAPLGMKRTITSTRRLDATGNFATPHTSFEGTVERIDWVNWDTMAPAGGVISSANDMARWLLLQLGGGSLEGTRVFSESAQRVMWTPHNVMSGPLPGTEAHDTHFRTYALGWSVSDFKGRFTVGHGGAYDGMFSQVWLMPEERLGIVVLTNCDRGVMGPIVDRIRDAYLGLPEKDYSKLARETAKFAKTARKDDPAPVDARPPMPLRAYSGTYGGAMYGDATVTAEGAGLVLRLLPNPNLVADLTPLDADTFTLKWRKKFAFFAGGRAQFIPDTKGRVVELRLDVPNNDFWFDELELKRNPQ
jgi:CubicO group peptidase (beta-lactamase class C family)